MDSLKQGLIIENNTARFNLYAPHCFLVEIGIFHDGSKEEPVEIASMLKKGDFWQFERSLKENEYFAYRLDKNSKWLADPFAKALDTSIEWGKKSLTPFLSPIADSPLFDWENTTSPNIAKEDLVIYEMHVRGFTIHPSSGVSHPGSFEAIIEKIPYLKSLGINCIELMPIFEFSEFIHDKINYWGYDPISYFCPKRSYAADQSLFGASNSFKMLVKELHRNQMEIILDVVYNHTGESDDFLFSLRGIDKTTYYLIQEDGKDFNFSGCKNTVNTNHPQTQKLILESLRYWVNEMKVDGFRFDLASVFTRGNKGQVLAHPPILEAIKKDPILSQKKLIAEAWDAAGLYQVGLFPSFGNWSEWNGRYRDIVRNFMKGTPDRAGKFAAAISGSDFIYGYTKTPLSSINFITAHDGFCLYDLVSFNQKHNLANGEQNHDGSNDNRSWNCGVEGLTEDLEINSLRQRQIRNFFSALFISQGIPMILMGDEYGHTRHGNNNPYVQDNELNWFLWDEMQKRGEWIQFVKNLIHLRKNHPGLRKKTFLTDQDVIWHGKKPKKPDWGGSSKFVAFEIDQLYIAFNANNHAVEFELPDGDWHSFSESASGWQTESRKLTTLLSLPSYSSLIAEKRISI